MSSLWNDFSFSSLHNVNSQSDNSAYITTNDLTRTLPHLKNGFKIWNSDKKTEIQPSFFYTENELRASKIPRYFDNSSQLSFFQLNPVSYGHIAHLRIPSSTCVRVNGDGLPYSSDMNDPGIVPVQNNVTQPVSYAKQDVQNIPSTPKDDSSKKPFNLSDIQEGIDLPNGPQFADPDLMSYMDNLEDKMNKLIDAYSKINVQPTFTSMEEKESYPVSSEGVMNINTPTVININNVPLENILRNVTNVPLEEKFQFPTQIPLPEFITPKEILEIPKVVSELNLTMNAIQQSMKVINSNIVKSDTKQTTMLKELSERKENIFNREGMTLLTESITQSNAQLLANFLKNIQSNLQIKVPEIPEEITTGLAGMKQLAKSVQNNSNLLNKFLQTQSQVTEEQKQPIVVQQSIPENLIRALEKIAESPSINSTELQSLKDELKKTNERLNLTKQSIPSEMKLPEQYLETVQSAIQEMVKITSKMEENLSKNLNANLSQQKKMLEEYTSIVKSVKAPTESTMPFSTPFVPKTTQPNFVNPFTSQKPVESFGSFGTFPQKPKKEPIEVKDIVKETVIEKLPQEFLDSLMTKYTDSLSNLEKAFTEKLISIKVDKDTPQPILEGIGEALKQSTANLEKVATEFSRSTVSVNKSFTDIQNMLNMEAIGRKQEFTSMISAINEQKSQSFNTQEYFSRKIEEILLKITESQEYLNQNVTELAKSISAVSNIKNPQDLPNYNDKLLQEFQKYITQIYDDNRKFMTDISSLLDRKNYTVTEELLRNIATTFEKVKQNYIDIENMNNTIAAELRANSETTESLQQMLENNFSNDSSGAILMDLNQVKQMLTDVQLNISISTGVNGEQFNTATKEAIMTAISTTPDSYEKILNPEDVKNPDEIPELFSQGVNIYENLRKYFISAGKLRTFLDTLDGGAQIASLLPTVQSEIKTFMDELNLTKSFNTLLQQSNAGLSVKVLDLKTFLAASMTPVMRYGSTLSKNLKEKYGPYLLSTTAYSDFVGKEETEKQLIASHITYMNLNEAAKKALEERYLDEFISASEHLNVLEYKKVVKQLDERNYKEYGKFMQIVHGDQIIEPLFNPEKKFSQIIIKPKNEKFSLSKDTIQGFFKFYMYHSQNGQNIIQPNEQHVLTLAYLQFLCEEYERTRNTDVEKQVKELCMMNCLNPNLIYHNAISHKLFPGLNISNASFDQLKEKALNLRYISSNDNDSYTFSSKNEILAIQNLPTDLKKWNYADFTSWSQYVNFCRNRYPTMSKANIDSPLSILRFFENNPIEVRKSLYDFINSGMISSAIKNAVKTNFNLQEFFINAPSTKDLLFSTLKDENRVPEVIEASPKDKSIYTQKIPLLHQVKFPQAIEGRSPKSPAKIKGMVYEEKLPEYSITSPVQKSLSPKPGSMVQLYGKSTKGAIEISSDIYESIGVNDYEKHFEIDNDFDMDFETTGVSEIVSAIGDKQNFIQKNAVPDEFFARLRTIYHNFVRNGGIGGGDNWIYSNINEIQRVFREFNVTEDMTYLQNISSSIQAEVRVRQLPAEDFVWGGFGNWGGAY